MPTRAWRKTRRDKWLATRKAKAKDRPSPVAVLEVNCMSVSTGPEHARQILRNAAAATIHGHPVDVILGCEADDFNAATVLCPDWNTYHVKDREPEHDGSFVAVRASRGHLDDPHLVIGSDTAPGLLPARWLAVANVVIDPKTRGHWYFKAVSGHAPPMRAWVLWPRFMLRARNARADVFGADFNKLAGAVALATGRRVLSVHILGLAVRWWIPASEPVRVDVDGDHAAVGVVLWP